MPGDIHIPDLNLEETSLGVLLNVDVDWEMCVDVAHLVLVALGDTNDHVVDEGTDGAQGSDILARAVVELDVDDVLGWVRETHREMAQVLSEFACPPLTSRSFQTSAFRCGVPLGPSTVTMRVLMWTLTAKRNPVSGSAYGWQAFFRECAYRPLGS